MGKSYLYQTLKSNNRRAALIEAQAWETSLRIEWAAALGHDTEALRGTLLAAGYDLTQFGHVEVIAELRESGWQMNDRLNRFVAVMARPTIDRDSVVSVLTQVTLEADATAPTSAHAAVIHLALIDALERQGRNEFARELYGLIAYATEVVKVVEGRRAELPSHLLTSTYLTPPSVATRGLDRKNARVAADIISRLREAGVKFE